MYEILEWLNQQKLWIEELGHALIIFLPTLSIVYIVGRMLEIVKTNRHKNIIAIMVNYATAYWLLDLYFTPESIEELLWMIYYKGATGILLYVLVGFKLYDRLDNLQDKKIADEKIKRKKMK